MTDAMVVLSTGDQFHTAEVELTIAGTGGDTVTRPVIVVELLVVDTTTSPPASRKVPVAFTEPALASIVAGVVGLAYTDSQE